MAEGTTIVPKCFVALSILFGCSLHALQAEGVFQASGLPDAADGFCMLQTEYRLQQHGRPRPKPFPEEAVPHLGQRLHIISVTGKGKYEKLSIIAQQSWETRLGTHDNYTNICDIGCGGIVVHNRSLDHILPMPDYVFAGGKCTNCFGELCDGRLRSQMKFPWGFIHEYRRLALEGASMPRWWLVKDDDTFVDIDRLMALAARYDPTKRIILANVNSFNLGLWSNWSVNGGAGWLASAAMAEQLVVEYGDEWLMWQETVIRMKFKHPLEYGANYDMAMTRIVDKVDNAVIVNMNKYLIAGIVKAKIAPVPCPNSDYATLHMAKQWKGVTDDPQNMTRLSDGCLHD